MPLTFLQLAVVKPYMVVLGGLELFGGGLCAVYELNRNGSETVG